MISFAKTDFILRKEGTMQAPIITLDEETLKAEMREVVRETVEQVINGILDAQADELVNGIALRAHRLYLSIEKSTLCHVDYRHSDNGHADAFLRPGDRVAPSAGPTC